MAFWKKKKQEDEVRPITQIVPKVEKNLKRVEPHEYEEVIKLRPAFDPSHMSRGSGPDKDQRLTAQSFGGFTTYDISAVSYFKNHYRSSE